MAETLHIRLLGEQAVVRGVRALALPPSKKTRALLAYLVLSRRAVRRERLCELLWDVADDPRAGLRWSLSKLRELVDDDARPRLLADRDTVQLALDDVTVDVFEARQLTAGKLSDVATPALERALALFRGELLEGLELPDFHAYYAFCLSEREALQRLLSEILGELLVRSEAQPERALGYARRLVELDPTSEHARTRFSQLLHASGRAREAALESRKNGRLLVRAATPPSVARERSAARAGEEPSERVSQVELTEAPRDSRIELAGATRSVPNLIGRTRELARLRAASASGTVIAVTGEAGLGKSTLVAAFAGRARQQGLPVFEGAARELERNTPYAALRQVFTDAGVALEEVTPTAPLAAGDEERALSRLLQALLAQLPASALFVFEDLHWFDRSSALFVYRLVEALAREGRSACMVLTLREGELEDNAAAARCFKGLRALGPLEMLALEPLSREDTALLVQQAAPNADVDTIFRDSAGHPLFALELARAEAPSAGSLARVVRERMDGLASELADVLRWAAVLGASFSLQTLEALLALEPELYVSALEQLARLGWLVLADEQARFSHEVVARAIYDGLSGPRRRLMHAKVARQLAAAPATQAAELAHHAVLAGDADAAVRALLAAGWRCLRLFSSADAAALAQRGLSYVGSLAMPAACLLEIELRELSLLARRPEDPRAFAEQLTRLAVQAMSLAELDHARRGFYLHAFVLWEQGRLIDAQRYSREAERCSRMAAPRDRLRGLADAAHCLAAIERDMTEAEAFVSEAEALIAGGLPEVSAVALSRGALDLYRGDVEAAQRAFQRACECARTEPDRMVEYHALEMLVEIDMDGGRWREAEDKASSMIALAEVRAGSELPFARAVRALAQHALGRADVAALAQAADELAAADAKHRSARLLLQWGALALQRADAALAADKARAALALAEVVQRGTEIMLARALALEAALLAGQTGEVEAAALRALAPASGAKRARDRRAAALARRRK